MVHKGNVWLSFFVVALIVLIMCVRSASSMCGLAGAAGAEWLSFSDIAFDTSHVASLSMRSLVGGGGFLLSRLVVGRGR